jgi:hypothetical protein
MSPVLAHLNHLGALAIFAALVSAAIAVLARRTARARIRYALWSFALFILVSVCIAWLMYPFSR